MTISSLAGKPAPKEMLVDYARLEREYDARKPDIGDPNQLVVFGTSGHRGSPLSGTFTDAHIAAITEVARALMHAAWESAAALAIAPLPDLLNLGNEARMNVPGGAEGNWRWRCTDDMLSPPAFEWLRDLTNMSGRSQGGSRR